MARGTLWSIKPETRLIPQVEDSMGNKKDNEDDKRKGDDRRFSAGTRSGSERRQDAGKWTFLEKRAGADRRTGEERRLGKDRRGN